MMRAGLLLICALIVSACTKTNPAFCCTSPADCDSAGVMETQVPCEAGFVCVDHGCTTASPACETNDDCTAAQPYCSADKVCVECVQSDQCPATAPTCDATTHACRACAADDDCASTVCDLTVGMCVPEENILYASPSGSDVASCARTQPCSITHAFAISDSVKQTIKLAAGSYIAAITTSGKTVTVDGFGATITAANNLTAFAFDNNSNVRLVGMTIINNNANNGVAISSNSSTGESMIDLDQVTIDSVDANLVLQPASAHISRSHFHGRTNTRVLVMAIGTSSATIDRSILDGGNGVVATGSAASVRITSSVLTNMQGSYGAFVGSNLLGQGTGVVFVSFSTVINSVVKCGTTSAPKCAGGSDIGACIDNTIIYNTIAAAPADTVQGTCTASYSIVTPQSTALAGSNNQLGVNPALMNVAGGDYHLAAGSPAIDAADPAATSSIDYDGVSRPRGGRSDIGAFESP